MQLLKSYSKTDQKIQKKLSLRVNWTKLSSLKAKKGRKISTISAFLSLTQQIQAGADKLFISVVEVQAGGGP